MNDPSSDDPKIIVDSDWKAQVQAEKEELKRKQEPEENTPATEAQDSTSEPVEKPAPDATPEDVQSGLPEPSFSLLLSSLVTQAAVSLGQMPDPVSGNTSVDKPMAKHVIDTLAVLEEKTKGNLDETETQLLDMMLHQLRVAFVAVK